MRPLAVTPAAATIGHMDRNPLIEQLPELRRELLAAQRRIQDARSEAEALHAIIQGIERLVAGGDAATVQLKLTPSSSDMNGPVQETAEVEVVEEEPGPRGREAVRRVMSDGRPWRLQAVIAEVVRRGWVRPGARNPEASIRETVRRLTRDGEAEKVGHATYRLVPAKLDLDEGDSG